jgi:hypothetical protein
MSHSTVRKLPVTAAEYLEGERQSDVRHEFVNGRVFYRSSPFPDDVERPWYLRHREDG